MLYNLDLHTHLLKNKQSVKKYWKCVIDKGLLGTAITEYASDNPKKAYFKLLSRKPKDLILIPGVKIKTDSGDVLLYSDSPDIYEYSIIYEENLSIKRIIDFANKKGYLISIAYPFGLLSNSATYFLGLDKLEKLIKSKKIGVEAYTGTIGYLSYYMFDSFFLRKLRALLNYLKLQSFFRSIGLSAVSDYFTRTLDQKSYDMVYKFEAAIKLGKMAKYITAGSASYNVQGIGSGVLTLDLPKYIISDENIFKKNKFILDKIKHKKIKTVGPPGNYTDILFERSTDRKTKIRAYKDLMYLTQRSVK